MTAPRHIAVIDIGKSNAKLALVDLETRAEIAVLTRPNTPRPGPPWRHFDTDALWDFILSGLSDVRRRHPVDGIAVTTHGASGAFLDAQGQLACPVLDYEDPGPDTLASAYDALRPSFAETGSPRLPGGLNLGAQIHWQLQVDPGLCDRAARIVTYPQYWAHRLTGVASCDMTSIGCHTDLWNPRAGRFSDLVTRLRIDGKIAPVLRSDALLGPILPGISAATGLDPSTPVVCGIHDSNASLYPHLLAQKAPFSVVSTGTWVIAMAIGAQPVDLDPARDTLVNVNALGAPVPSARFMGGREYALMQDGAAVAASEADIAAVLDRHIMLLPAVDPATGPFPGRAMRWQGGEPPVGSGERSAVLAFYLALMTATCLKLIGADGPTLVEGPFAANAPLLSMLRAATARPVHFHRSATGTSVGAALLFAATATAGPGQTPVAPAPAAWSAYAARWQDLVAQG